MIPDTKTMARIRQKPQRQPRRPLLVAAAAIGCILCVQQSVRAAPSGGGGGMHLPRNRRGLFGRRRRPAAATTAATTRDAQSPLTQGNDVISRVERHGPILPTPNGTSRNATSSTRRQQLQHDMNNRLEPSQVLPHTTSSGSILSGIYLALRGHLPPPHKIARMGLTGCQIGLCYFLLKATWQAIAEALEELSEDMDGLGGGGGGGIGVKEEHDRTWLDGQGVEEAVRATTSADAAISASGNTMNEAGQDGEAQGTTISTSNATPPAAASSPKRRSKRYVTSYETASDLARRLRASGMPMVIPTNVPSHIQDNSPKSVQHVLKSLTKTEGRLLSSALLSPADDGDDGILAAGSSAAQDRQSRMTSMWNDIGGLGDVKDGLLDLVFPLLMNQAHGGSNGESYYGGLLSNPPGVLLYGPPGCGKTSLARALAATANARVLCVSPSTLMRKYVGETELQVRALFSLARKIAPCIIFVDEVDGLFRERESGSGSGGGGEHDVSRDLKTEFMQLWDGIRSKKADGGNANDKILLVGATNRPFDVDPGFLRRMPRSFFVGMPDRKARAAVLRSMLKNVPLSSDFDVEVVATATDFYSPSDLKELLRTAALVPLREARFKAINEAREAHHQDPTVPPSPPILGSPALRPLTTADVLGSVSKVAPTQLSQSYIAALSDYASRSGGVRDSSSKRPSAYGESSSSSSSSKKPYQHPSGYYVHKADDGSFLADIGTFSADGHNPSSSGLGVFDSSSSSEYEEYDQMRETTGYDEDTTDDDYDDDDDDSDDEL